ncbi:hypothetical protein SAY87_025556 [Trapa incisa]|uniref:RING-type domain-containing protein n=1 Tax=Trapa incisa TaxID=236973 RepID=A0AAN7JGT7_9MYRT|nr:hypothetical protein SAY87_025556 [Trapa incisa]
MSDVIGARGEQLVGDLVNISIPDSGEEQSAVSIGSHIEICAICLDKIELEEIALIKGCEHVYCATCILRWATYKEKPTCPQCKSPFEFLNIHRSLDGSLRDYMAEESVCLLLRAMWFKPLVVEDYRHIHDDLEDYIPCEDGTYDYDLEDGVDDLLDEDDYFSMPSGVRICNRRWGENGYVRAGRREARPIHHSNRSNSGSSGSSSSRQQPKGKEIANTTTTGRRARRTLKREAADKALAEKQEMHLASSDFSHWIMKSLSDSQPINFERGRPVKAQTFGI